MIILTRCSHCGNSQKRQTKDLTKARFKCFYCEKSYKL